MKEQSFYKLKSLITHSPLHKPLMEWRAKRADNKIKRTQAAKDPRTIYIVSPYKTGTTYIDSLWDESISKHEPFQLYSLRDMEKDFESNFYKRENVLDLKLECSGFLTLFLEKLPKTTMQSKYIYILRPPSKWVGSVIKHFYGLRNIGYNYINEYYWKRLLGYDMLPIIEKKEKGKLNNLVQDLYQLYFDFLTKAEKNTAIFFVQLENIDNLAVKLGERIGVAPNFEKSWKRESKNKLKIDLPLNKAEDEKYNQFIKELPQDRFYPL